MLKNNNLSYTQSLKRNDIEAEILSIIISTLKRIFQFVRSLKHDDINKSYILLFDEQTYLITTS